MLQFTSILFNDILVGGKLNMRAERRFKLWRNFELYIYKNDLLLLHIATATKFLDFILEKHSDKTDFNIAIVSQSKIIFEKEVYEIKVDRLYLFKSKYGEILINGKHAGKVLFAQKFPNSILNFLPDKNISFDENTYTKIAILILINIANLDGSE